MDLESKMKRQAEFMRLHTLTEEDLKQLIKSKLERAERYHLSLKERERRAELD